MKKELGDHIGKKRGWAWFELLELIKLAIKNIDLFKKKK
jgi:hypothetical protein